MYGTIWTSVSYTLVDTMKKNVKKMQKKCDCWFDAKKFREMIFNWHHLQCHLSKAITFAVPTLRMIVTVGSVFQKKLHSFQHKLKIILAIFFIANSTNHIFITKWILFIAEKEKKVIYFPRAISSFSRKKTSHFNRNVLGSFH